MFCLLRRFSWRRAQAKQRQTTYTRKTAQHRKQNNRNTESRKHRHLPGFLLTSLSRLAAPGSRQTAAQTAAESATHDDKIHVFFRGSFLSRFYFFCYPLPLSFFISIFWRGARGAQNEAKDAANPRNGKAQKPQKSSILNFFRRGETAKSVRTRRRRGRKKSKFHRRGSGGYPPARLSAPPFRGSSSLWGGGVAPLSHDFLPSTGTFTSPFTSSPNTPPTSALLSPNTTFILYYINKLTIYLEI